MVERSVESIDVSSVSLADAVEFADDLSEAGQTEALVSLAERVLPRFLKKERLEEIEGVWIACCASGALPLPVMLRTAERLVARGREGEAPELLVMLVETLVENGRAEEALNVVQQGLSWTLSEALLDVSKRVLAELFPEAPNLDHVVQGLALDHGVEGLLKAERALRYAPGTFLRWTDHTIAQVVKTDGISAEVRHPSGSQDRRAVDEKPPPRVLSSRVHEVRRLFEPEELQRSWRDEPLVCLMSLLAEQGGVIAIPSLKGVLVPRIVTEPQFDEIVAELKVECGLGHDDKPTYDSRRRMFIAPGCVAPKPKRSSSKPKAAPKKREAVSRPRPIAATPSTSFESAIGVNARWADLTLLPEIRELIAHTEGDVTELKRELNVDLPVRLEEARAHGDLRENAEYDAAKERLQFVQARIEQLRDYLAQLHELSRVRLIPGRITAMSVVIVADEATGEERPLRLVPSELRHPQKGDVSIGTPYAKALLGKVVGDTVVVRLPRRTERLEIVKVIDPDQSKR